MKVNFHFVVILCLYRNGQLFEYNHFIIISHYCFYIKSSFVLWYYIYHTKYLHMTHMFYQYNSRLSLSITSDVGNPCPGAWDRNKTVLKLNLLKYIHKFTHNWIFFQWTVAKQYGCFESCQFRPRSVFFLSWRLNKSVGDFRCLRYYCDNVSIS